MQSLLEANYAVGVVEGLLDDNLTVTYASRLSFISIWATEPMTSSGSTAIRFWTSCTPMTAGSSRRPSRATARCPRSFAWPTSVARPCPCGSAPSATRTAAATGRSAMPWACSSTLTKVSGKRNLRACSTRTGGSGSFSSVDVTALWACAYGAVFLLAVTVRCVCGAVGWLGMALVLPSVPFRAGKRGHAKAFICSLFERNPRIRWYTDSL